MSITSLSVIYHSRCGPSMELLTKIRPLQEKYQINIIDYEEVDSAKTNITVEKVPVLVVNDSDVLIGKKAFEKISKFRRLLGSPAGLHATTTGRPPGQHKMHIFSKSSDFAAEGCKFSISGFSGPLREVTFSEFSLTRFL